MKPYLLIVAGLALAGLAVAKVVGLAYLSLNGTDKPPAFFAKQAAYAIVFLGAGVVVARNGWKGRGDGAEGV